MGGRAAVRLHTMFPHVSFLFYDTEEEGRRGGSDARPGGANEERGCVDRNHSIILPILIFLYNHESCGNAETWSPSYQR